MVDGKLPETLFVQVDGGAENANKLVLAVLSYLVAKRVLGLQKIVLTRLPVGHTHEDIDGIFGRISRYIYDRHVITPQAYAKAIKAALKGKSGINTEVIDLYVIPDYESYFSGCIDKFFGCAYKGPHAKLQFIMEKVPVDTVKHPLGVKLTYRRYCQDVYPLLFTDKTQPLGIGIKLIKAKTFPADDKSVNVLLSFPPKSRVLRPDKFVGDVHSKEKESKRNKREPFMNTIMKYKRFVEANYSTNGMILAELQEFIDEFPNVLSVDEWILKRPEQFYIPFKDVFESDNPIVDDFRYADMRSTADKDTSLYAGLAVEDDEDTLKRSTAVVVDGMRVLYNTKVPKVKDAKPLQVYGDYHLRKFSVAVGLRYFDREENTENEIKSVSRGTDVKGKQILQYEIHDLADDESNVSLVSCATFIKDALSERSIYRFRDHDAAIETISTLVPKPRAPSGAPSGDMTVASLKAELTKRGVAPKGLKGELLGKLREVIASAELEKASAAQMEETSGVPMHKSSGSASMSSTLQNPSSRKRPRKLPFNPN